ncbi:NAD(P)-binding domain-containing protein [Rothia terrae]|uniref:NAD(P)-binding domain-containing protein n=1 Tax=Rothia terrae TaxID=396015 RepID=UPI0033DE6C49
MVSPDKCGKVTRKIAVLGSKMVGQALSEKLVEVGHSVVIGTRNPEKTKASTETSQLDPVSFSEWYKNHSTKEQMVEPAIYGETTMFISGEDEDTKNLVITEILQKFGWAESQMLDLGGIVNARGTEMSMRLYFQLAAKLGTFEFSFVDVKNK